VSRRHQPTHALAISPAFQFYARDQLVETMHLSLEECGIFFRLQAHCWLDGSLPAQNSELAKKAAIPQKRAGELLVNIRRLFYRVGKRRLRLRTLERERAKQRAWRNKSSEGGRKGAAARWGNKGAMGVVTSNRNRSMTLHSAFADRKKNKKTGTGRVLPRDKKKYAAYRNLIERSGANGHRRQQR
jgi:uncharacterized protein YdaU (DUF1376 family)